MNSIRIFGIVVFIVGIVLLAFGLNATGHFQEEVSQQLTGKYTDETMWYILGGIAMIVGGGLLALFWKRKS